MKDEKHDKKNTNGPEEPFSLFPHSPTRQNPFEASPVRFGQLTLPSFTHGFGVARAASSFAFGSDDSSFSFQSRRRVGVFCKIKVSLH